jgi:hypothetical protein
MKETDIKSLEERFEPAAAAHTVVVENHYSLIDC